MKKRIAIITPTYPPYRGGIGKVAEEDAQQLRGAGFSVDVFVPSAESGSETLPLRTFARYGKGALVPGVAFLPKRYDLTFLHYPFFGAVEPLTRLRPFLGGKLAVVYHMDVVGRGFLGAFFRFHKAICMPKALMRADRILVTSMDYVLHGDARNVIAQRTADVRELPPSVDTDRFSPGPRDPALCSRYGIAQDDRVVVMVGGLDPAHYFKGVPVMLKALTVDELSSVRLVVVGSGSLQSRFAEEAVRLGVANRVIWAGNVSDDELPRHYRLANIFAFPSIDRSEAFGIAALEAMSCGIPVVASNLPGVRTIVREGNTGRLVHPGSVSSLAMQLFELFSDMEVCGCLGKNGRRMAVEEYCTKVRAERLVRITKELL